MARDGPQDPASACFGWSQSPVPQAQEPITPPLGRTCSKHPDEERAACAEPNARPARCYLIEIRPTPVEAVVRMTHNDAMHIRQFRVDSGFGSHCRADPIDRPATRDSRHLQ